MTEDFKRVHGKTGRLFRVTEASSAHPDRTVREVVFPVVSVEARDRDYYMPLFVVLTG
jgi:hypothetical protein